MKIIKILIINPFGIGDVLFSTPLINALNKKYPGSSITYICNKRSYDILKNNPHISNIYIFEKDDYRKLWAESKLKLVKELTSLIGSLKQDSYDMVFDMSLGYIYSLVLLLFVGIPIRVGFNYRARGRFLTHKVTIDGFNKKHVIEYYLGLGGLVGLDISDKEMELAIAREDRTWADVYLSEERISKDEKICGIIPGCGASWGVYANHRRWSTWKFAEVADYIASHYGHRILIFGEEKEHELCMKTQSEMKTPAIQLCGETKLSQFSALLDRCDIVITNDGGPLHMAVALKKKTISIFGPVDEHSYGPYPPADRSIVITAQEACRPCYKNFKHKECGSLKCLANLRPDKVIKAVDILLKRG